MIGVKTCLLPRNTHKNRRKTQNSFVPYLTSACPAHRSSRTANSSAPLLMSLLTILQPDTASSSKTCWTLQHKNGRRIFAPTTIVLQYVFRLFYYLENSIQNDLEMLFVLNKPWVYYLLQLAIPASESIGETLCSLAETRS